MSKNKKGEKIKNDRGSIHSQCISEDEDVMKLIQMSRILTAATERWQNEEDR